MKDCAQAGHSNELAFRVTIIFYGQSIFLAALGPGFIVGGCPERCERRDNFLLWRIRF